MMKKITLMFTLLVVSFGYSQSLPFDFSDPIQLMTGQEGTSASLIDDAGNDVMEVVGGMTDWDHVAITFAENVDLSDDSNNTMTLRIKPTTDLGTRNHILKFEGGVDGDAATEMPFTSTGTDWQDITLDMPAGAGNYSSMIIFTDAGGGTATGTYLIDDVACSCGNIAPPPAPEAILPIDFSDAFELFAAGGSTPSLTTDPLDATNAVMQVDGGAGDWDNVTINFAQNVDLSDDTNNTITFRINPLNGTGSNNHLLKFEQGTTAPTEVAFTTTGTGWQDVSLDFPAGLGNYALMVLFTDAGSTGQDVYLVDDFAGATNIVPVEDPEAAPLPTSVDGDTYSIYNDTNGYTTVFPVIYSFGTIDGEPDLDSGAGVNQALKCDFSFSGFGQGEGGPDDVSAYNFVNFMYWAAPGVPGFQFRMISNDGGVGEYAYEIGTQEAVVTGQWTQVSIPMSYFTGLGFSSTNFFQWKVEAFMEVVTDPGIVFIDNIILTQTALSVNQFDTAQFSAYPNPTNNDWNISSSVRINTISVFDVLGKEVISLAPNANEAVIDASSLKTGMYFAKIEGDNGSKTVKLIKE
ncbi:T9SS type A sorting domain-containing protein [uncultured Winogradskyella sp.]|uniref:T9SS type A sorting domain-containing protein n=1 Tax=uncultured Winogradskyella sp. TaxID=395353 RepID=UPI002604B8CF|nr:T9SS type A sorting domain-containing protein [uncultured Winogradskyella sp.]